MKKLLTKLLHILGVVFFSWPFGALAFCSHAKWPLAIMVAASVVSFWFSIVWLGWTLVVAILLACLLDWIVNSFFEGISEALAAEI